MKHALLIHAVELLDDDLIAEAANATTTFKKKRTIKWPQIAVVAACLTMICLAPIITKFFEYHAEDPDWYETHSYAYSVEEAIEKFGSDLLLDKLVLNDDYSAPYVEFILEHAEGDLSDHQGWKDISATINYGGERFSTSEDHVSLHIFFQDDDPDLDGTDEYPGYRSSFNGEDTTTIINGVTVRYREYSNNNFAYAFCAEFKYNGKIYFLETFSNDNSTLSWDTLNQMLN